MPPATAALVLGTVRAVLRDRREHSVDYAMQTPRGNLRFEARVIPMEEEFDERPCVLWAARDTTERDGQEAALRQSQLRFLEEFPPQRMAAFWHYHTHLLFRHGYL